MIRDLVFHLGDFKTGSTALQDWLARGGAGQGIFHPATNHAPLADGLADSPGNAARFTALAKELRASDQPHAVVSAEHFELADPARLLAAIETYLPDLAPRVRLLAYVRPHAEALLARYGESVKIGNFTEGLDSYLALPATQWRLSYAPRFARWRAAFGSRFTLRLYRRADFPGGDVTRDFAAFVTGRDPGPPMAPHRANPSPSPHDLALFLALHRAIGPLQDGPMTAARWTLGRHLGRLLAENPTPNPPLRLHRALAEQLASRFAADAAATDAGFLAGTPLTDALAIAPAEACPQPMSLDPAAYLSPDALAVIALWAAMLRTGLQTEAAALALSRIYHESPQLFPDPQSAYQRGRTLRIGPTGWAVWLGRLDGPAK